MGERPEHQRANIMSGGIGESRLLDLSAEQVVRRPHSLYPSEVAKRVHLVNVIVGHTNVADLPRGNQFLQRPGRLLGRRVQIGPMDLIDVDVVGSEATQAGLHALAEPPPAGVAE
jgi:hypothetical protein